MKSRSRTAADFRWTAQDLLLELLRVNQHGRCERCGRVSRTLDRPSLDQKPFGLVALQQPTLAG